MFTVGLTFCIIFRQREDLGFYTGPPRELEIMVQTWKIVFFFLLCIEVGSVPGLHCIHTVQPGEVRQVA